MSDSIITVEGLGKRYRLASCLSELSLYEQKPLGDPAQLPAWRALQLGKRGARNSGERYTALRDVIANSISAPFRRLRNGRQRDNETTRPHDGRVVSSQSSRGPSSDVVRSQSSRGPSSDVVRGQLSGSPASSNVVSGQSSSGQRTEEFWALKDINFEVRQGEVLASCLSELSLYEQKPLGDTARLPARRALQLGERGIIARNGAGKSTLLKILRELSSRPKADQDQGPHGQFIGSRHRSVAELTGRMETSIISQ